LDCWWAVSYNDGSSSYDLSGRGDNSATSLSLYGTWQGEKGHYLDLLLKESSIRNDYTVYNDFGHKLKGNYKTWGTSLSAEYGRNIQSANGIYFDPSIMLTLGRIQGSDYSAASDFLDSKGSAKDMAVSQDGFNSAIGRISIGIGQKTKTRTLFSLNWLWHMNLPVTLQLIMQLTGNQQEIRKLNLVTRGVKCNWVAV